MLSEIALVVRLLSMIKWPHIFNFPIVTYPGQRRIER
jgi:hypothetical protein